MVVSLTSLGLFIISISLFVRIRRLEKKAEKLEHSNLIERGRQQ